MSEGKADTKTQADEFKAKGNAFFKDKHFQEAVDEYTKAIELFEHAVYFSNRAACYLALELNGAAQEDASKAIELDPSYIKGYYRRGASKMAMGKFKEALKDFVAVAKQHPRNPEAKRKVKSCKRCIKEKAFAEAIAGEESKAASEVIDWKEVHLPSDWNGPTLDDDKPIDMEFALALMEHYRSEGKDLPPRYVFRILMEALELLKSKPTVVDLNVAEGQHITVCGDVHGQYYDLLHIFELNGVPSAENPYVFNGDFVDRGSWSLEIILLFFCFKLADDNCIHLNRGNHETTNMNSIYGFKGEVIKKVGGNRTFDLFTEVFDWLPLCHLIGEKVLILHGGLFSEDGVKMSQIREIKRNCQPPDSGLMCEILWSDPQVQNGRSPSKRGVGLSFGPDVTKAFLEDNDLSLLVRSHEVKNQGYEVMHNGQLITIFSAPNYCDQMGNYGAFIRFESDLQPKFTKFEASPHPNVRPMAYASPMFRGGMM